MKNGGLSTQESSLQCDAFISYSRRDLPFAQKLEDALRRYKPPKGLAVPPRYLRIFRDQSDIHGPEYLAAITKALETSATLIVICSPHSASSPYVNQEIDLFSELRGKEHIIPLLLEGIPNNEATEDTASRRAFPEALVRLLTMPLAADYRGFDPARDKVNKGRFASAWFKTLADVYADYGVDRERLEQRERHRTAQRRRNLAMVSAAVALIVIGLTFFGMRSRSNSEARRLAGDAQRQFESADQSGESLVKTLLLSVASTRAARTVDGHSILNRSMGLVSRPPRWRQVLGAGPAQGGTVTRHRALAFSPNGARIAVTDGRGPVQLLDAQSGQMLQSIEVKRRPGQFAALAFSPDGAHLIVGCGHESCVLDAASGRELTRLSPADGRPNGTMWSAVFSPDGRLLATSSYGSRVVSIYDTSSWNVSGTIVNQQGSSGVFSLAFSPNGDWLATGTPSGVQLWRTGKYDMPAAQARAAGVTWSIAFWPDGEGLVAAGGTLQAWNIESNEEDAGVRLEVTTRSDRARAQAANVPAVIPVLWHGSPCLASAAGTIRVLCGDSLDEMMRLPSDAVDATVSPDRLSLAVEHRDGTLALWPLDAGFESARVSLGAPVRAIDMAEQGRWMAAGTNRQAAATDAGEVVVLDLDTWRERKRLPLPSPIAAVAASADGRWLAVAEGSRLHVFDASNWREMKPVTYPNALTGVHFSAQDRALIAVSDGTVAALLPPEWNERLRVESQRDGDLRSVRTSPDGRLIAITWHWNAGHDTGVEWRRVFDLQNGKEIGWQFSAPGGSGESRTQMERRAAQANRAVTGGDVKSVEEAQSWPAEDTREFASGDDLWSVKVSGSRLELTDKAENRVIGLLSQHGEIAGAYFLPQAAPRWIVSGGEDGTVARWPVLVEDLADQACARLADLLDAETLSRLATEAGAGRPCSGS